MNSLNTVKVRHWTPDDLGTVAEKMLDLRQYTFYGQSEEYQVSLEELVKWLVTVYADPRSTAILCEENGEVTAVAGVTYGDMVYPPYLRTLYEWCLWGDGPRSTTHVWREAKEWAKQRGVLFAKRSILQTNRSHEHVKWEKLL